MKIEVICQPNNLAVMLNIQPLNYYDSIKLAFDKIEQTQVFLSWNDFQTNNIFREGSTKLIEVPVHGCFKEIRSVKLENSATSLEKYGLLVEKRLVL